ncbi:hypothetical protein Tco_1468464 [Tanacetum coccineum]
MKNSVTIAYRFELHFNANSLDGLKPRNIDEYQASLLLLLPSAKATDGGDSDGGDGGLKGCLDPWHIRNKGRSLIPLRGTNNTTRSNPEACKEDGDDVLGSSMEVKLWMLLWLLVMKIDGALCGMVQYKGNKVLNKGLRCGSKD